MLKYDVFSLGEMATNCYLVWDEKSKEAVIIDPGDEGVELAQEISSRNLKLKAILLTHGHFDHAMGVMDLKLIFKAPIAANEKDAFLMKRQQQTSNYFGYKSQTPNIDKIDLDLNSIDTIPIGKENLEVIKTPGHTPGSVCFYAKDEKWLFTGDTLFADGSVGETSHKYSSKQDLRNSIEILLGLPEATDVLPGHGEATTVAMAASLVL